MIIHGVTPTMLLSQNPFDIPEQIWGGSQTDNINDKWTTSKNLVQRLDPYTHIVYETLLSHLHRHHLAAVSDSWSWWWWVIVVYRLKADAEEAVTETNYYWCYYVIVNHRTYTSSIKTICARNVTKFVFCDLEFIW